MSEIVVLQIQVKIDPVITDAASQSDHILLIFKGPGNKFASRRSIQLSISGAILKNVILALSLRLVFLSVL